jgi:hypothetical protein
MACRNSAQPMAQNKVRQENKKARSATQRIGLFV